MNHQKLNWLRAGVLGANDGIISISTLLIATIGNLSWESLTLVAISSTLAGALSMAIGEYISVSAQKDAEIASGHEEITNPYHAAISSFLAFLSGATIPAILAISTQNLCITIAGVLLSLLLTGYVSGKISNLPIIKPILRNGITGMLALAIGIAANIAFTILV